MGIVTFNNISSDTYGIYVQGGGAFNAPELDYNAISVPGKNGDVIISNKRYKNIVVSYNAYIYRNFAEKARSARAWLLSPQGYVRLSDSYHEDEYRLAMYSGEIEFDMRALLRAGTVTLKFNCKPQRFLTSGETAVTAVQNGVITNPTLFEAKPLLTIQSSSTEAGTVTINGKTLNIASMTNRSLTVDCDTMNAYYGTTSLNSAISGDFPVLAAGDNLIAWTGSISGVTIIPRWCTL